MKRLNYINCIAIEEYDLIVDPKDEPSRSELIALRPSIDTNYTDYLNNFETVAQTPASNYSLAQSILLKSCYGIKTVQRNNLIARIVKEQTVEFQEICGYCLYYLRTTIDHYIPQEEFSEYSVMPRNLLPCCSTCNATKNRFWRDENRRLFIHLYNDTIPNVRFVFGSLNIDNGVPTIEFTVENVNNTIDFELFKIINSHYKRLSLCQLYSVGISKIISDIDTDVKSLRRLFEDNLPITIIQNFILKKSSEWKLKYGINYWRSIAYDILANSEQFLNTL